MKFLLAAFVLCSSFSFAQGTRKDSIDVLRYNLDISINDSSDVIYATEFITLIYNNDCDSFSLDFSSLNENGRGMIVTEVMNLSQNNFKIPFYHSQEKLWITLDKDERKNEEKDTSLFAIVYSGIPIDGLVIGENKYGKRTFFGDNWPNRAHNWFACVDHPSDKASVHFKITAPAHYEVVATGENVANVKNKNGDISHTFNSDIQLPTKVMVFGAADFQVQEEEVEFDFPLSSWIYQQENVSSFSDLSSADEILSFFIENIGNYPFEKLANVQSTTRYGGMENAGNIFYDENAFSGNGTMEALIAHEIAHQWFGNSASESDWQHLWLSEGFVTYFTDLYWESKYGTGEMNKRLSKERVKVIRFSKQYNHAVIDTNYTNLLHLLNPNSYQKGAWVLHMLRNEVGENDFWKIVRSYYEKYQFSNASSTDFIEIVNEITEKDYSSFFNQWLKRSGQPKLKAEIKQKGKKINIELNQVQKGQNYSFPIEVLFIYKDGTKELKKYCLSEEVLLTFFKTNKKLDHFILDPNVLLLFEEQ